MKSSAPVNVRFAQKALCCAESWWIKMTEDDVRRVIWFLIEGWRVACAHVGPSSEPSQTDTE